MDLTPTALIRAASLEGIDLNLRSGHLHAIIPATAPPDLVAILKAHRYAIRAALETIATSATLRDTHRCPVMDLDTARRQEAETLAADLARTGGLGQFICDLFHTWNDLEPADHAAACLTWQLVATQENYEEAA